MLAPLEEHPPGAPAPVFAHTSVMRDEIVARVRALAADPRRAAHRPLRIVDVTLGGAGHSSALLEALPHAQLLGIDRDPQALAAAGMRLAHFGERVTLRAAAFADTARVVTELGWLAGDAPGVDALVMDLGVSSHQLDEATRGFSFRFDAPLDMRMDTTQGITAAELLADIEPDALARILRDCGEERFAKRVARKICTARPMRTFELAELVRAVLPPKKKGHIDPATRTFQALRIAVNDELGQLERLLAALPTLMRAQGQVLAISFHSLEDRALKHAFVEMMRRCRCPRGLPVCLCDTEPSFAAVGKQPALPSSAECLNNPRARSAKLRTVVRLPA